MKKIDWEQCNNTFGKWGKHSKLTPYLSPCYGEIIKVHDDGSCDIRIDKWTTYHDEDLIIRNINDYHIDFWEEDNRDRIIKRRKSKIEVGNWVQIQEFRNLFYIGIYERDFHSGKMRFMCGKPKHGFHSKWFICHVGSKDYIDSFYRFRRC